MATLVIQTPDVASTETVVIPFSAHSHYDAEEASGTFHDEAAQHTVAQAGRGRSRKGKNGQKKQPQRGLGVAQLEKLRLQEQTLNESVCFASFRAQTLPISGPSVFGELGNTLSLPHSFGYLYNGKTSQAKSFTPNPVRLETLKSAQLENGKFPSVSNSLTAPGKILVHGFLQPNGFHPLFGDKTSAPSSCPTVRPQQKGIFGASCVPEGHDLPDLSLNHTVIDNLELTVNERDMFKIVTPREGEAESDRPVDGHENPKIIAQKSLAKSFLSQIRYTKSLMSKSAEPDRRNVSEPQFGHPESPSVSFLNVTYTPSSDHKQETERATDGSAGNKCQFSSSLTNVELFDATLGPPGIPQPQPFYTDISSVIYSSFGGKPKELSSFQNYLDLHVWPSIEKPVSAQKRKWPDMQDASSILHAVDIAYDCKAFEPPLKSQRYADLGSSSVSDYKVGALCGFGSERKLLTKSAVHSLKPEAMQYNLLVPTKQKQLPPFEKWTESTQSGNLPFISGYIAQPIVYSTNKTNSTLDQMKAHTFGELRPVQMVEKVYQALPSTEACEMKVQGQQHSPTVGCRMFLLTEQSGPSEEGYVDPTPEYNTQANGIPLDLSLRLAL